MNGGWGVGWTVELKLNRKRKENFVSNRVGGGVRLSNPPLDP